jgi:hypothetical protein
MDIKYLIDGKCVNVVKKIESGFLVQLCYDDEENDEKFISGDEIKLVGKVYDSPPEEYYVEKIKKYRDAIDKCVNEKDAISESIRKLKHEYENIQRLQKEKIKCGNLNNYLENKITHFVLKNMSNDFDCIIMTIDELFNNQKNYSIEIAHIYINRTGAYLTDSSLELYKSSSRYFITPFSCYADAVNFAKNIIDKLNIFNLSVESGKKVIELAKLHNIEIDKNKLENMKNKIKDHNKDKIKNLENDLKEINERKKIIEAGLEKLKALTV